MSGISLKKIECPYCGGNVSVDSDRATCFCTYCGRQIAVDDGVQRIHIQNDASYEYVDVARMRELELQEEARIRREEEQHRQQEADTCERKERIKKWLIGMTSWLVLMLILLFAGGGPARRQQDKNVAGMIFMFVWILGSVILGGKYPLAQEREHPKLAMAFIILALFFGSYIGLSLLVYIFMPSALPATVS